MQEAVHQFKVQCESASYAITVFTAMHLLMICIICNINSVWYYNSAYKQCVLKLLVLKYLLPISPFCIDTFR